MSTPKITIPNNIVGTLLSVDYNGSADHADTNNFLLKIGVTVRNSQKVYLVVVTKSFLEDHYDALGIDRVTLEKFYKGTALPASLIQNDNVQIRAYMDTDSAKKIASGTTAIFKATHVEVVSSGAKEPDQIYQPTTSGKPGEWPGNEEFPRFPPVPVTDDTFYRGSSKIRIGYAVFDNPIHYVEHSRSTNLQQMPAMRQAGTLKRGTGNAYETYNISYIADGPEEIRKSVQEVIEQISLTPFLTAEGGPFGELREIGDIPHHAIAVRNFSISTVDGLPGAVQIDISFDPFNWQWFVPPQDGAYPRFHLDDMICWPLFKVWAKTRGRSQYDGQRFSGKLALSFPNEYSSRNLDILLNESGGSSISEDVNALSTLLARTNKDDAGILSRNAKEILYPEGEQTKARYYVIKLSDQKTYNEYINSASNQFFAGLVDWSPLAAANLVDSKGNLMAGSATTNIEWITQAAREGKPLQPDKAGYDPLGIATIKRPGSDGTIGSINDQIQTSILAKYNLSTVPSSGDSAYSQYVNEIAPLIKKVQTEPWTYFGILIQDKEGNNQALKNKLNRSIKKYSREQNYEYDNSSSRARRLFADIQSTTTVLSVGTGPENDVIVERISGSRGHNLALSSARFDPLPLHSYMGGLDATFVLEGKCFGFEAKKKLEHLKEEFDTRALYKSTRKLIVDGKESEKSKHVAAAFMKVDNEIFQLMGVDFVMPVTLTFQSVDGQPNVWTFSLTLIEFDPKLKKSEQVQFLPTTWSNIGRVYQYGGNSNFNTNNPLLDRAVEYFSLQASLAQEETYPDMNLPTKGELDFWLRSIYKGAALWTEGTQQGPSLNNLNQQEQFIVNLVKDQFYPHWADRIKASFVTTQGSNSSQESSARVNPDFYCYYDPSQGFANIFEFLTEHLMGKRQTNLQAPGRDGTSSNPNVKPLAPYREYDPQFNLTNVYSHKYWAGNAELVSVEKEMVDTMNNNSFPQNRAKDAMTMMQNVADQMDATPDNWWKDILKYGISWTNPEGTTVRLAKDQENAFYDGIVSGKQKNPQKGEVKDWGKSDFTVGNAAQYFDLQWRQKEAIKVAGELHAKPLQEYQLTNSFVGNKDNNYYWATNPEKLLWDGTSELTDPYQTDQINSLTIEDIQKSIDEFVEVGGMSGSDYEKKYDNGPGGDASTPTQGVTNSSAVLAPLPLIADESHYSWVVKTALVNSNYRYWKSQVYTGTWVLRGDVRQRITDTYNWVDYIAGLWNLDPNIIRAYFLKRDGFGSFTPLGSVERGFGDLDPEATNDLAEQTDLTFPKGADQAVKNIQLFAQRYRRNLDRFNSVPTIALIATDMELTFHGRRLYFDTNKKDLKLEVIKDLQTASSAIATKRYSQGTGAVIQGLVNKYTTVSEVMDEYYAGYIEVCRTYGSYLFDNVGSLSNYDPYFSPLNPLIVMDLPVNESGKIQTNFTPSGKQQDIRADRSDVKPLSLDLDNSQFDMNKASLEIAARQARKMRAAMDPQSESAIYGSLLDMREHSTFGKLVGAFPAFQVLLINEGFYWAGGNKKLWDEFYTRTGVSNIEVFRTRHQPGGTASITFSNMFYNITAYAQMEAKEQELAELENKRIGQFLLSPWGAISDIWNDLVIKNVPKDVIKIWQENHLKRLALSAGTRIQIRMGYGSNAADLPIVFNGTVVEAPVAEGYVTLTAVSDGYELEKPSTTKLIRSGNSFAFSDGGFAGIGKDPSSIITEAMIGCSLWDNIFQGNFRDFSQGISHFGEVYFEGFKHYPTEVQINIYSSSPTKIEQGINTLQNYFSVNAIYNWNNEKNLFSVEVQEPTPWKVAQVCRRACGDFVSSPEWFCNRSTLFFGKWWWPYHYEYDKSIIELGKFSDFSGVGFDSTVGDYNDFKKLSKAPDGTGTVTPKPVAIQTPTDPVANLPTAITDIVTKYSNSYKLNARIAQVHISDESSPKRYTITLSDYTKFIITYSLVSKIATLERVINGAQINPGAVPNSAYPKDTKFDKNGAPIDPKTYQPILDIPILEGSDTGNHIVTDFLKDVENFVAYLKWKPYMQAYIAHSGINLLSNDIRADATQVYTDAMGLHMYNGYLSGDSVIKTITYSVDTDIHPSDRRTMLVDTGILLTGVQSGLKPLSEGALSLASHIPVIGGLAEGARVYINETPTTPAIENAVVAALVDQVKEMYQGWFGILGTPTVKPHDLFLLTDHVTDLKGPVFVKEVIHRMDSDSGFITLVSPDACVFPHTAVVGQQIVTSLAVGALHRIGAFMLFKTGTAATLGAISGKINRENALKASDSFQDYQRLKNHTGVTDPESKAGIYDKIEKKLQDDLKNAQSVASSTNKVSLQNLRQAERNLADFQNSTKPTSEVYQLSNQAKKYGVELEAKDFNNAGNAILGEQAKFEAELAAREAADLKRVTEGKVLQGLGTVEERQQSVKRYYNNLRAQWAQDNAPAIEQVLGKAPGIEDIKALQNRAKALLARQQTAEARNGQKAVELSVEEVKELEKIQNELTSAIETGKISARDLDVAVREIIQNPAALWYDEGTLAYFKDIWKSATGSIGTITKGAGKTLVGAGEGLGSIYTKAAAALASTSNRAAVSVMPTNKTNTFIKLKGMYKSFFGDLKDTEEGLKTVNRIKRLAKLKVLRTLEVGKDLVTGVRIMKYMGPQAIVSLAVDALIMTIGGSLIEGYNARLRARQCVKIIPLMAGKHPYTAGIKGHQGAVIGDSPSWADELIADIHGQGQYKGVGPGALMFMSALAGIEVPDYGMTPVDQLWIDAQKREDEEAASRLGS